MAHKENIITYRYFWGHCKFMTTTVLTNTNECSIITEQIVLKILVNGR